MRVNANEALAEQNGARRVCLDPLEPPESLKHRGKTPRYVFTCLCDLLALLQAVHFLFVILYSLGLRVSQDKLELRL